MKNSILAVFGAGVLIAGTANADTLWLEDFNDSAIQGKGAVFTNVDMSGITKWSIDVSDTSLTATSDWFQVKNNRFEARDLDGVAIWQSEAIDISGLSNLQLSLSAYEQGTHEADDFIDIAYSIDGAEFQKVPNWQGLGSEAHTLVDDFTQADILVDVPQGTSLTIQVSMQNGAGSEYLRIDDVMVASSETNEPPVEQNTITNACFNCPDLSKVMELSEYDSELYYADAINAINAEVTADELKNTLSNIIANNHTVLSYSQVWTALTQTDEDPLNPDNVILLYKGTSIAKFSNGSGSQSTNQDNWNREHVWAKSHGFPSSSASAYTDIHHLRPTDISINSSRGNLDFDLSDQPLTEAPANRVDADSFEPRDEVKGDVARMLFYMDTRYQGNDPQTPDLTLVDQLTSVGEAKLGKLCTLLNWHVEDSVDEAEQKRNDRIYEFQGNRNPFIDNPDWAEKIYDTNCETGNGGGGSGETPPGESSALFFSEYVEGSGFNKAIEIFNPTNSTVSLAGYQFKLYSNGNTNPTSTLSLTGEILPQDVVVVVSSQASETGELASYADVFSNAINFNGDDYIELVKDGEIVDNFGQFGERISLAANVTLVRNEDVSSGLTERPASFNVSEQWTSYPSNTFTFLGSHQSNGSGEEPTPIEIGACGDNADFIFTIQGQGESSIVVGENKIIEGIVTATLDNLDGFFVQEEASQADNDLATSDAIFVSLNGKGQMPTVGNRVRVSGEVSELFNRTQLSLITDVLDCGQGEQIVATEVTLPVANSQVLESLEGMLVSFPQSLSVTDTYNLARYGQFSVSSGRLVIPTNVFNANSAQAIALADKNSRNRLIVDDKNNQQNPDFVPFPNAGLSYNNTLRLGDKVEQLTGIIDYSYSEYRVLPTQTANFVSDNLRNPSPDFQRGELTIASFNVLNYFNGDGLGGGFPTARGADTFEEFERQSDKIVSAIAAINADVIGLMELENDGYDSNSAIAQLTDNINNVLGEGTYQYIQFPGERLGNDAITLGLLYKPAVVSPQGNAVTTSIAPFDFGNRQPLVQSFSLVANNEVFTVVVNHFKSKGSCSSAIGLNQDQGDGQGCWNNLRLEAATTLVNWLATDPTNVNDQDVIILGDLNAYGKEDPINQITANGYRDLMSDYMGTSAYSYSFGGEIGYLDHALASDSLAAQVIDATVWHINADEPRAFDYNVEFKSNEQLNNYYGSDAFRASDHDPIIISLALSSETILVGDLDLDGDVDRIDVNLLSQLIRSGNADTNLHDFNQDTQVNFNDVRALMALCTRNRCASE